MKISISTFNIENLFTRHDYSAFGASYDAKRSRRYLPPIVNFLTDFRGGDFTKFEEFKDTLLTATVSQDDDKRQHTALAMTDTDAKLFCLQEVDNMSALTRFRDYYLKKTSGRDYKQIILHEGNDFRGIDVAALATDDLPIFSRSHAHMTRSDLGEVADREKLIQEYPIAKEYMGKRGRIFNRDCLELEIRKKDKKLTVFVCHFKSMSGGRDKSMSERTVESLAVRHIIQNKYENPAEENWIIVGDLNDYRQQVKINKKGEEKVVKNDQSGFDPLIDDGFSVNLMDKRDEFDRWTHYYSSGRTKTQLDYVLVSPALAKSNPDVIPDVIRKGIPYRVPNTDNVMRYPRIGWDRPKASDHCPIVVTIDI